MVTNINVVIIKDNVVDEAHLFSGKNRARVVKQAEAFFCKKVQELSYAALGPTAEWDEQDLDDALDDGYVELTNGSVCITWPTEHPQRERLAKV